MAAFGRYELLRRVGSGGMADIWKARTDGPGGFQKSLAIKRILPDLVENREFLRMFADEAKLVASLSHPNIVQVLDFGHVGKHDYFIAMEYVAGVNLARLLNRAFETSRLPPELALYVVVEATRGLGHAHTRPSPIIHRDVSPQNILLSFSGEVKLTDFGIARVSTAIPRTAAGHVRGKVAYMSPEQAAADASRPVDVRSDLFSLGIILYEMMTGRRLFPGGSSPENHARVITYTGPTAEELAPVPPVLRDIVSTALQGNPDDRFQSAEALEAELTAALGADVFVAGKQFLASYLPPLFPDEFRSEKEEDAQLVPKTNVQVRMSDVDALPPRPSERVSTGGGVIPEPVTGGDTVISAREPSMAVERSFEGSVSVSVTVAQVDVEEADPEDPEETRVPFPFEPEEYVPSGLTLAPPVPAPVAELAPERSTRTREGFEEPLYPPQPKKPTWLAPALLAGGVLVGGPLAIGAVFFVAWLFRSPPPEPPPAPTPFAMVATATPTPPVVPVATATAAPVVATPADAATPSPVAEDTTTVAVPLPSSPGGVPREAALVRATATPVRTARPLGSRTPAAVPATPEPTEATLAGATGGTLRVDAQPACEVFVDHSHTSETTPFEHELSAGRHTLGFVHKPSGLWLEKTYDVPAGGTLHLYVDVNQATVRIK